jgi:hypothetical protein
MPHQEIGTEGLRSFFERFQRISAAPDLEALAGMFTSTVMMAGPSGARAVSSADMLNAVAKRKRLFESAGHRETALVGFEEQSLTDRYSIVRTEWRWRFERGAEPITVRLPATFIVDRSADSPRIVVYVMHHDIAAELQGRDLLPPTA